MNNLAIADRLTALKTRNHAGVKFWKPSLDDTILAGIIRGADIFNHSLYGEQKQLVVEDENGQTVKTWMSRYVETAMRQQNAEVGDLICIEFLGKKTGKNGNQFNAFNVSIEKMNNDSLSRAFEF